MRMVTIVTRDKEDTVEQESTWIGYGTNIEMLEDLGAFAKHLAEDLQSIGPNERHFTTKAEVAAELDRLLEIYKSFND